MLSSSSTEAPAYYKTHLLTTDCSNLFAVLVQVVEHKYKQPKQCVLHHAQPSCTQAPQHMMSAGETQGTVIAASLTTLDSLPRTHSSSAGAGSVGAVL